MTLKVLLAGKHELACGLLRLLSKRPGTELAVVPAKSERSDDIGRESLKRLLQDSGIAPLADEETVSLAAPVRAFRPDALISAGFDRIIKPEVFNSVPHPVNIHFGMLPSYRGNFSIPMAILNAEPEIGVTLHRMSRGIDDGDIIEQVRFPNQRHLSCREIYDQAVKEGLSLAIRFLDRLSAGERITAVPQNEGVATYYPPKYPNDFRLPVRQLASYALGYVRAAAFPPYGAAFVDVDGHRLEILWPAEALVEKAPPFPPGTVVKLGERWAIALLNGFLVPTQVRLSGASVEDFDAVCIRLGLEGRRCA